MDISRSCSASPRASRAARGRPAPPGAFQKTSVRSLLLLDCRLSPMRYVFAFWTISSSSSRGSAPRLSSPLQQQHEREE